MVAGDAVGTVTKIELGDNGQALVTFNVNEDFSPLPRGTTATVRSYSLSGIANRQIQLTFPPEGSGGEEIPDNGTMTQAETVSEVDLDQVFNTLDDRTVRNLKKVIRGFEISYDGVGEQANEGFRYLNPFLSTSRALFGELARDERSLEQLIVDTSRLSGALSERAPDISQLVGNLDRMMSAIASQSEALGISVQELPEFMRTANTTFVNLRAALDDLTPLVEASKPAAIRLQPFLEALRQTAADAVPTIEGLDQVVLSPGAGNDLVDLTRLQVPLEAAAIGSGAPNCGANPETDFGSAANGDFTEGAFGESVCSLRNGLPPLAFLRAYTNELVGWFDGFSHSTARLTRTAASAGSGPASTPSPSPPTSGLPFIGAGPTSLGHPTRRRHHRLQPQVPRRQRAPARRRRPRRSLRPLHRRLLPLHRSAELRSFNGGARAVSSARWQNWAGDQRCAARRHRAAAQPRRAVETPFRAQRERAAADSRRRRPATRSPTSPSPTG